MKLNKKPESIYTHEGGKAKHINPQQELQRAVMACLLWEDSFYESGIEIASRIIDLVPHVRPNTVASIAIEAREKMKLRHVPLLIAIGMLQHDTHRPYVKDVLSTIIQRPDELTEVLSIYWKDGRKPLAAQLKKGLALAFPKFSAYQLAKYNRDEVIKLRDVLFLCHAKPKDKEQEHIWKKLIDGSLEPPDTWEVALSAGKDKKETWIRLIEENKLGGLALLRNLRNMYGAGVPENIIISAIERMKTDRILPFRFIAASRYAMQLEPVLEKAMFKCLVGHPKLGGWTTLLVDVSGSMDHALSSKSDMTRLEAACGLAMLLREIAPDISIYTFSYDLKQVPTRRGFALRDAIVNSQQHGGTYLGKAVRTLKDNRPDDHRLIVITDEQAHDDIPDPKRLGYVINVASYQNGVGYGRWNHIDGWSEAIIDYILTLEDSYDDMGW